MKTQKYQIGTQFMSRGKFAKICTVIDVYTTFNSKQEIVKINYVASHLFNNQNVVEYDVTETAISMGLVK